MILREQLFWRQKLRELWLKEGDKCTKFFHRVANSNRRNNSIDQLEVNGRFSLDQSKIRDHVVSLYETV
jgi:hypothetical protein